MPRLELKSLWSFLAIKCFQRTKSKKVIYRSLMAFMAVDDGIAIGDTPRVFWRGEEIATSHQPSECN